MKNRFKKIISSIIMIAVIFSITPGFEVHAFSTAYYETNKAYVNAWSHPGSNATISNSYKKRNITYAGTVLKIVDKKSYWKIWYFDDWYKTSNGDWVFEDHIKKHTHAGPTPSARTTYSYRNTLLHNRIVTTNAKECTKCQSVGGFVMQAKDTNTYFEFHNLAYNSGKCTACGYAYPLSYASEKNKLYDTTASVTAFAAPYPDSGWRANLSAYTTITASNRTYNAFGSKWIQTTNGYWLQANNLRSHNHNYNYLGICSNSSCDARNYPKEEKISTHTYVTNASNIPKYSRPYFEGASINIPTTGTALNCVATAKNHIGQTWYKTEDGRWILSNYLTKHANHNYDKGKCSVCGYIFPLEEKKFNPEFYETNTANVYLWGKPYSNTALKRTIGANGTVVLLVAKAKNELGNLWYKTSENSWVYSERVKKHNHKVVAGACTSKGCSYVVDLKIVKIPNTVFVTNKNSVRAYRRPYTNAEVVKTFASSGTFMTFVEKTDMNPVWLFNDWWYKTSDGMWVHEDNLTSHKHTIAAGACTSCKYECPITVNTFAPAQYETTAANVVLWARPYVNTGKKDMLSTIGTKQTIIASAKNNDGETWFKTSAGYWVSGKNVKLSKNIAIVTSFINTITSYSISVLDTNNKPIYNANVRVSGIDYKTNTSGTVIVPYNKSISGVPLEITCSGYGTYSLSNYYMKPTKSDTIKIARSDSYTLLKATMTFEKDVVNLLTTEGTINVSDSDTYIYGKLYLSCYASSGFTNIKEYRLVQDKKILAIAGDGNFIDFAVSKLVPNKAVYIHVVDTLGVVKTQQKLLLNIISKTPEVPKSMSFGDDISFTISENAIWPFAGKKLTLGLPALPVTVKAIGPAIQVGINFDVLKLDSKQNYTWETLKSLNKGKFKDFYKKHAMTQDNVTDNKKNLVPFKLKAGGYAEGSVQDKYFKGKVFVEVSSSWSQEYQWPAAPIPVMYEIAIEGSLQADGTIKISKFEPVDGSLDVTLEVAVTGYAGVGMAGIASVGMYGSGKLGFGARILPWNEKGFNEIYGQASFGFKAKAFGNEIWNLLLVQSDKVYFYRRGSGVMSTYTMGNPLDMLDDVNDYVPMDRSYLDNRTGWMPNNNAVQLFAEGEGEAVSAVGFDILQASTYTDIKPQVVSAKDTIMMAYIDDNAARGAENRTMLVYSLYDTLKREWSAPKAIRDDGTADFNYKLYSDGERIYIIWQNAKNPIPDNMSITDTSKQLELYVAQYDVMMGSFQNVEAITNNNVVEAMPQIVHANGKTTISWFENSMDDIFGKTGQNTIYFAQKSDAEYVPIEEKTVEVEGATDEFSTEPNTDESSDGETPVEVPDVPISPWSITRVNETQPCITSLAIGKLTEDDFISFTIDTDNDTTTVEDQIISLVDMQSNTVTRITDKAINAEFTKVYGENALTWFNAGNIYYLLNTDDAPQIICSESVIPNNEYHIISDNFGRTAVLYTVRNEASSDAFVILYDAETLTWGLPVRVTMQDKYVQNFNGAFVDGMIVSVFNQTNVTGENLLETNNLCSSVIGERRDLTISSVVFDDVNVQPGADNPLSIEVRNSGTVKTDIIKLTITDENGALIEEKTFERNIRPGDAATLETTLAVPEQLEKTIFKISISQEASFDVNLADNNYDLIIGRAALTVSAVNYKTDEDTKIVITVKNDGFDTAGGSLALYENDGSVKAILLENFEPLAHGDSVDCVFAVDEDFFDKEMYKVVNFGVLTDAEQYTTAFNSTSIMVRNNDTTEAKIDVQGINLTGESASGELSLFAVETKFVSGTIMNESEENVENADVYIAAYGYGGELLEVGIQSATVVSDEEIAFERTFTTDKPIYNVKVFLVEKDSLRPLSVPKEIYFEEYMSTGEAIVDDLPENYQTLEENY